MDSDAVRVAAIESLSEVFASQKTAHRARANIAGAMSGPLSREHVLCWSLQDVCAWLLSADAFPNAESGERFISILANDDVQIDGVVLLSEALCEDVLRKMCTL
jgi:hypothetical protein